MLEKIFLHVVNAMWDIEVEAITSEPLPSVRGSSWRSVKKLQEGHEIFRGCGKWWDVIGWKRSAQPQSVLS